MASKKARNGGNGDRTEGLGIGNVSPILVNVLDMGEEVTDNEVKLQDFKVKRVCIIRNKKHR